jgi:alkane 1-monooxygenase
MKNLILPLPSIPIEMLIRDLKYLLAYLVPLSAAGALYFGGPWSWSTVVLVFVLLPLLELVSAQSTANFPENEEPARSRRVFFDLLLYLNLPLVYGVVLALCYQVAFVAHSPAEIAGLCLSAGIVAGANGINVAHELGHRHSLFEQFLSKTLLLPALYQHFFIEHNRGHHKYVATERDPATARLREHVYAFWWRSVRGSWRSAWNLERERLRQAGQPEWSWHNEMLRFQVTQGLWLLGLGIWGGLPAVGAALAAALVGVLLLETVNYLEHYGLQRRLLPSGRYEPVSPAHSWNSNHELGRIFLYELTRHSDHHFKATRKYQILRHLDESPQLPFGYPASLLMALVPPLWFAVMHPRIPVTQPLPT